jgi:hypothetical protein
LLTITAAAGTTINGGSTGGSITLVAAQAIANAAEVLLIAQSTTAWIALPHGTDANAGMAVGGALNVGGTVTLATVLAIASGGTGVATYSALAGNMRIDQLAAPTNSVPFNTQKITGVLAATTAGGVPPMSQITAALTITTGALPTITFVSGTATQVSTTRRVVCYLPVTFTPSAGAAATATVQLSADNFSGSTIITETVPLGVTFDGFVKTLTFEVPQSWYVKVTLNAQCSGLVATYA